MKIHLFNIIFIVLYLPAFGSLGEDDNNSTSPKTFTSDTLNIKKEKNEVLDEQIDLNIQFLSLGLGYKKRIYKDLFLGIKGSAGLGINFWFNMTDIKERNGVILEKFYITSGVYYLPSPSVQLYFGLAKVGLGSDLRNSQINTALKFDFLVGKNRVKYGIKLTAVKGDKKLQFLYSSFLTFKILLNNY